MSPKRKERSELEKPRQKLRRTDSTQRNLQNNSSQANKIKKDTIIVPTARRNKGEKPRKFTRESSPLSTEKTEKEESKAPISKPKNPPKLKKHNSLRTTIFKKTLEVRKKKTRQGKTSTASSFLELEPIEKAIESRNFKNAIDLINSGEKITPKALDLSKKYYDSLTKEDCTQIIKFYNCKPEEAKSEFAQSMMKSNRENSRAVIEFFQKYTDLNVAKFKEEKNKPSNDPSPTSSAQNPLAQSCDSNTIFFKK